MGLFSKKRKTDESPSELEDDSASEVKTDTSASVSTASDVPGTKEQPAGPLDVKQLGDQDTSQYADF